MFSVNFVLIQIGVAIIFQVSCEFCVLINSYRYRFFYYLYVISFRQVRLHSEKLK